MTLHQRIATALGWTVKEAQSFSMPALRALVRPVDPKLADEITFFMAGADYIRHPVTHEIRNLD